MQLTVTVRYESVVEFLTVRYESVVEFFTYKTWVSVTLVITCVHCNECTSSRPPSLFFVLLVRHFLSSVFFLCYHRKQLLAPLNLTTLLHDSLYMSRMPHPASHLHGNPILYWSLLVVRPSPELMTETDQYCWEWVQGKLSDKSPCDITDTAQVSPFNV